jgi:hypothetical protein
MGFNPFRPHRRSPVDYVMVAAAVLVALVLLLWAAGAL